MRTTITVLTAAVGTANLIAGATLANGYMVCMGIYMLLDAALDVVAPRNYGGES